MLPRQLYIVGKKRALPADYALHDQIRALGLAESVFAFPLALLSVEFLLRVVEIRVVNVRVSLLLELAEVSCLLTCRTCFGFRVNEVDFEGNALFNHGFLAISMRLLKRNETTADV